MAAITETFNFPATAKKVTIGLMLLGLAGIILGFIVYHDDHHAGRVWANILFNTFYFLGIALTGVFLTAAHQIGYGGWHTQLKRIFESTGSFIPVAGISVLFILGGLWTHYCHIYHWTHEALFDPSAPEYDPIIAGKQGFLNLPFYSFRIITYLVLWTFFAVLLRRISIKEDEIGGLKTYKRNKTIAAIFLIVFAVTSSTSSWDFLMSVDPHWYSTLFGWYNFASYSAAGVSAIALVVIFLKVNGYLKSVNEEHLHNLGLFMFGFSVFWAYLWFSQFMLIWYGNMPEETVYFSYRWNQPLFKVLFYVNLLLNFFFPFLFLMTRASKRNMESLGFAAVVMLIGHWVDYYLMVMPGAVGEHASIGWLEISITLGYVGAFSFVVLNTLTKASLIPVNNPYLGESLHHHTLK